MGWYKGDNGEVWGWGKRNGGVVVVRLLSSSPVVKNLTHLDLGRARITAPEVLTTIATSPHLSNLVSLDLFNNKVDSDTATSFAASTTLTNLTHLALSGDVVDDEFIAQLFSTSSPISSKLRSFSLTGTKTTVSSLEVLLKACPYLTELIIAMNAAFGPAETTFIATQMPNLTKLELSHCTLSGPDYAILAASTTLTNLRELSLHGNLAQPESIAVWATPPQLHSRRPHQPCTIS
jgi:Leucine-rich repeat (LRR) protein